MSGCPGCRRELDADATFCPHCGLSLEARAQREARERLRAQRRRLLWILGASALLVLVALLLSREPSRPLLTAGPALDLEAGRAAVAAGEWAEAVRLLSPEGAVPPGAEARSLLAEAWHELCLADSGAGLDRALRARELSLADDPRDVSGLRARAVLESSFGSASRAVSWWEEALRHADPAELEALLLDAAVARAVAGEAARAELLLEELLQAQPDHARGLANRGLLHLHAGRLALAESDLQAALLIEPGLGAARAGLVETMRRQGREAAARIELKALLARGPDSVTAWHVEALFAEQEGRPGAASTALQRALGLAPGEARLEAELERIGDARP